MRQAHPGAQSALGCRIKVDITAMRARYIASDGKAEASSAGIRVAGLVEPIKRPKDILPLGFWNSGSVVVDGNFDVIAPTSKTDPDVIAISTSIGNQVIEATAYGHPL